MGKTVTFIETYKNHYLEAEINFSSALRKQNKTTHKKQKKESKLMRWFSQHDISYSKLKKAKYFVLKNKNYY